MANPSGGGGGKGGRSSGKGMRNSYGRPVNPNSRAGKILARVRRAG